MSGGGSSRLGHTTRTAIVVVMATLVWSLVVVAGRSGTAGASNNTPSVTETFVPNGPDALLRPGPDNYPDNSGTPTGAVEAAVVDPEVPSRVWVASVNGGVWRTDTFGVNTPSSPSWATNADHMPSLSITSLALDLGGFAPGDTALAHRKLVSGFGEISSTPGSSHGPYDGVMVSNDGGNSWSPKDSLGLAGQSVTAVAVRDRVIIAATGNGLWRSTDDGASFTPVPGMTLGTGSALIVDPLHHDRLYAAMTGDASGGIFRSDAGTSEHFGETWTRIGDLSAISGTAPEDADHVKLAATTDGARTVLAGIGLSEAGATNVFRTGDAGAATPAWATYAPPAEDLAADDSQSKLTIGADPTTPELLYMAGGHGDVDRCDIRQYDPAHPDAWCVQISGDGQTANATAPHVDARSMTFDGSALLETNDGGIYMRTRPSEDVTHGDWYSKNGNLAIAETTSCGYDDLADVTTCGLQDNGTDDQAASGDRLWRWTLAGDGAGVSVSEALVPCDWDPSQQCSTRYFTRQNLFEFTRGRCTASNDCGPLHPQAPGSGAEDIFYGTEPALHVHGGGAVGACVDFHDVDTCSPGVQFYTPFAADRLDGNRMIVATDNVYESTNGGDELTRLTNFGGKPTGAILYGGRIRHLDGTTSPNPDLIYVGSDAGMFVRADGSSALHSTKYDAAMVMSEGAPTAVTVDPNDEDSVWVATDKGNVEHNARGTDPTSTWQRVGGLDPGGPHARDLQSITFIPSGSTSIIVAGADDGAYVWSSVPGMRWHKLSGDLPNVIVTTLQYDQPDDLLLIGTLGRSTWLIRNASNLNLPLALDASTSDTSGDVNDAAHFRATLRDGRGGPVGGRNVQFTLGSQSCTHATSPDGVAACDIVLDQNVGNHYTVTATVVDDPTITDDQPFSIVKEQTSVSYTGPTSADYDDPVTLTAKIVDPEDGVPIAGKSITFHVGDAILGQTCPLPSSPPVLSGADGIAQCVMTLNQRPTTTQVTASFDGGKNYEASAATAPFTITREETSLALDPPPHLLNGTSATVGATLTEDTGSPPIGGEPVTFTLGSGATAQTCSGTTDIHGHVQCPINPVAQPGSATSAPLSATYGGSAFFLPSSASATARVVYYQGRATGATSMLSLLLHLSQTSADTGLVSTSVQSHTERLQVSVSVPPASIRQLDSTVDTGSGTVTSTSTAEGVTISLLGLPAISISSISASAVASCSGAFTAQTAGHTTVASLKIGGVSVNVTSAPNQTVDLGVAKLVINEQRALGSASASAGSIVNGLHVTAPGVDLVIAGTQAAVFNCP